MHDQVREALRDGRLSDPVFVNPEGLREVKGASQTQPGFTGRVFDVNFGRTGVRRGGSTPSQELRRPKGLVIRILGPQAAQLRLTVGDETGGSQVVRDFTLTRKGVWLTAAGWGLAKLEVITVGAASVVIQYGWTVLEPQGEARATRLLFLESIQAGGPRPIPEGANAVTPSATDAGWSWRTEQAAGVPLTLATGVTAGQRTEVCGDQYTAGINNTLCWELWAP